MEGHVYLSKGSKDVWLGMRIMCLSGGTCLPEQREQRHGMRIMCLSGGTCLPEQREQRRMAWN